MYMILIFSLLPWTLRAEFSACPPLPALRQPPGGPLQPRDGFLQQPPGGPLQPPRRWAPLASTSHAGPTLKQLYHTEK